MKVSAFFIDAFEENPGPGVLSAFLKAHVIKLVGLTDGIVKILRDVDACGCEQLGYISPVLSRATNGSDIDGNAEQFVLALLQDCSTVAAIGIGQRPDLSHHLTEVSKDGDTLGWDRVLFLFHNA